MNKAFAAIIFPSVLLAVVTIFGCSPVPSTVGPVSARYGKGVYQGAAVSSSGQAWKSTVTLEVEGGRICSATLISKEYALSAAHCVKNFAPVKINFYDGSNTVIGSLPITEKHSHPGFAGGEADDMLIVRFSGAFPTTGYQPVPLLSDASVLQVNGALAIVGVGLVGPSSYGGMTYAYLSMLSIDERDIVATDTTGAHSACLGDSGGSGYVRLGGRLVLAGVTRSIDAPDLSCSVASDHTTFTLVPRYVSWIKSVISRSGGDPAQFVF